MWETLKTVLAVVGPICTAVVAWLAKNQEEIEAIFLKVQKAAEAGTTGVVLEQMAVDEFFLTMYPKLPFYVKFGNGKKRWEDRVRKLAKYFCKKAKLVK